jgi:hypothetical protein
MRILLPADSTSTTHSTGTLAGGVSSSKKAAGRGDGVPDGNRFFNRV